MLVRESKYLMALEEISALQSELKRLQGKILSLETEKTSWHDRYKASQVELKYLTTVAEAALYKNGDD